MNQIIAVLRGGLTGGVPVYPGRAGRTAGPKNIVFQRDDIGGVIVGADHDSPAENPGSR